MPNKIVTFAPLLLAVCGGVVYHVAAKSIPRSIEPSAALIGLYATALAGSVLTHTVLRSGPVTLRIAAYWHPTVAAVGLGVLIVELGFLLAYRGAWPVSTASVLANSLVAVILVPLGVVVFREPLTLERAIGIVLCLLGVALLQR